MANEVPRAAAPARRGDRRDRAPRPRRRRAALAGHRGRRFRRGRRVLCRRRASEAGGTIHMGTAVAGAKHPQRADRPAPLPGRHRRHRRRSSARASGRTGSPSPAARRRTRGSSPSAAATCARHAAQAQLVRANIYPVPEPDLPFLGAHLTRTFGGDVLIGPSALIAPARDAYSLRTVRSRDLGETLAWPGTWRLMAKHWRAGLQEIHHAASHRSFVAEAARLVPGAEGARAHAGPAGISAQALAATASWSTTSSFTAPSGRSTSATPPRPPRPPRWRWPG